MESDDANDDDRVIDGDDGDAVKTMAITTTVVMKYKRGCNLKAREMEAKIGQLGHQGEAEGGAGGGGAGGGGGDGGGGGRGGNGVRGEKRFHLWVEKQQGSKYKQN